MFELSLLRACQAFKLNAESFDFTVWIKDFTHRKVRYPFKGNPVQNDVLVRNDFELIRTFTQLVALILIVKREPPHADVVNLVF